MISKESRGVAHVVDENTSITKITGVEMSENRQALNKIIGRLANLDVKLPNYNTSIRKRGVSSWAICTIIFTVTLYHTGNKKNSLASKFLCEGCAVTNKHALTGDTYHNWPLPKKFEEFAIRNKESFTRVFKAII